MTELADLVGPHTLSGYGTSTTRSQYGDEAEVVVFRLDGVLYCATEDPEDGYRSCMKDLAIATYPPAIWTELPETAVVGRHETTVRNQENDVLVLTDTTTGKDVLRIGTANLDDYYPYFDHEWTPENLAVNVVQP